MNSIYSIRIEYLNKYSENDVIYRRLGARNLINVAILADMCNKFIDYEDSDYYAAVESISVKRVGKGFKWHRVKDLLRYSII